MRLITPWGPIHGERSRPVRTRTVIVEALEARLAPSAAAVSARALRHVSVHRSEQPIGVQSVQTAQSAADPAASGVWTPPQLFKPPGARGPYVAIDVSVLPDGTIIAWGHDYDYFLSHKQAARGTPNIMVWNPQNNQYIAEKTSWINLFCGGHTFLPNGDLLVAGGHAPSAIHIPGLETHFGHKKVALYDFHTETWTRLPNMNGARYYGSVITLGDGSVLAVSGDNQFGGPDALTELYKNGQWISLPGASTTAYPDWYPHIYQLSDGLIYGANPGPKTFFLDVNNGGRIWPGPDMNSRHYYGTSVMYAPNKILALGGKTAPGSEAIGVNAQVTNSAEVIDLNQLNPTWREVTPMAFPRLFPNATLLPDGTVLVTGGTSQEDNKNGNALAGAVAPVELWNPTTETWTTLASLTTPRLYHSTAILLPDARVLVAGGGQPESTGEPKDTVHQDMQIFSPPYLFRGPRPVIAAVPGTAAYGATIPLTSPDTRSITRVTLVRLGSVTHGFNMTQRIEEIPFDRDGQILHLYMPTNSNDAPPGYYMLFVLNGAGVPSVSKMLQLGA